MEKTLKIALSGNPNCGKTTLFNKLTGSSQYVGNWPGVTVEKKEGTVKVGGYTLRIVDLPGIYSLSPYSPEEVVTRNFLIDEDPDIILDVVDATNIERNLYLTTQIAELGIPTVVALNMCDILEKNGDTIDCDIMRKSFNMPFVKISANKGTGIEELLRIVTKCTFPSTHGIKYKKIYSDEIEGCISSIEDIIKSEVDNHSSNHLRWTAVKLFEGDKITQERIKISERASNELRRIQSSVKTAPNFDREMLIADGRYKYICGVCDKAVKRAHKKGELTFSDKIDRVVTNKYLAIPIFLGMILLIFAITFGPIGGALSEGVAFFIEDILSPSTASLLENAGASGWAVSLVVDGIIGGVGSVLSFLPQILLLFFLLSILEDSGYMARAAFITDKLLRKIGLSGRAFVPMLMGFGCTVPAVMGTRILESEKDKRLTILITPFMSCSAKMPVYSMFIMAFFAGNKPLVIFSIYLLGIIVAVLSALLFKNTILKGEPAPFVMELPPYRIPSPRSLWLHVWERIKDFLTKAGTVLLGASIAIWFLQSFTVNFAYTTDSSQSILAAVGTFIAPVFTLCGFGNWEASVSLVTGIVAKESVISTMSVLFKGSTIEALAGAFTPISAYSFMIFVLLYTPCVAALATIRREMGSAKWTLITIAYQILIAWFASALFFQVATLIQRMI